MRRLLLSLVRCGSALTLLASLSCVGATLDSDGVERQIKAAYLFNFAKYVTWPSRVQADQETTPLRMGVVGDPVFAEDLKKAVAGKKIGGSPFEVLTLAPHDDLGQCHILFVGAAEQNRWASILAKLGKAHVLTVSDMDRFTERGGIVRLFARPHPVRQERTVLFQINADAARAAGLKVSSKLLQLSKDPPQS